MYLSLNAKTEIQILNGPWFLRKKLRRKYLVSKCLSLKLVDLLGKLIPYYSITSINYLYLIPNMLCKYLLHRIILQNCSCMPIFVAQYFSLAKGYYFDTAGLPIGDEISSEGAFSFFYESSFII